MDIEMPTVMLITPEVDILNSDRFSLIKGCPVKTGNMAFEKKPSN